MSERYICIHGHFYQPPRENAWLEVVEMQESAYPDHDWNQRITRECYEPNAKARLLDEQGRIVKLVSNYARMSFNFGPTLLMWMKEAAPKVHDAIVAADKASAERFGGHGSAMAQAHNHPILPLCNERDRRTQVLWGKRDFQFRFGRDPEGLWLPEAAVNTESLEQLAANGIKFTVLAPRQCAAVRKVGDDNWEEINGSGVDPSRAYTCRLPSGTSIALFFYDGPVSQAIAFEGLLQSGDRFADRLLGALAHDRQHPQLMHVATDGESYGHHHRHGEMALAAALERIDHTEGIQLTNYAQFLQKHPPEYEARVHENSSWSCAHGVERWKSDCGCNSGKEGFHQRWRAPLRDALDWLRDSVARVFEKRGSDLFKDPWAARDDYIDIILDRSPDNIAGFFKKHANHALDDAENISALSLMELQRHAMLMYTSCAWFFDDVAGIEGVQVLQYAARVVQLARTHLNLDLESEFLERLAAAKGSIPEMPDGRAAYEKAVRPAMLELPRVAAHYALKSAFDGKTEKVYAYDVEQPVDHRATSGRARFLAGHALFRSRVTLEHGQYAFAVLHLGDHTVSCGVREYHGSGGEGSFEQTLALAQPAFDRADFAEVIRILDREFGEGGGAGYTIGSLFRDEQHAVVRKILEPTLQEIDASYRQIYDKHAPLAKFLRSLNLTVPRRIKMVGMHVLSQGIRRMLDEQKPDLPRLKELLDEAASQGVTLDEPMLIYSATQAFERAGAQGAQAFATPEALAHQRDLALFARMLPFSVDTWPLQEAFIEHALPQRPQQQSRADEGDKSAAEWLKIFTELAQTLGVVA